MAQQVMVEEPPIMFRELPERELDAHDRCDTGDCGARAYVAVVFVAKEDTPELLFCGHHYGEHQEKLSASTVKVIDQRASI